MLKKGYWKTLSIAFFGVLSFTPKRVFRVVGWTLGWTVGWTLSWLYKATITIRLYT